MRKKMGTERQTTPTATAAVMSVTVNAIACGRMAKDAVERMRNSMGMNRGIAKEQDIGQGPGAWGKRQGQGAVQG